MATIKPPALRKGDLIGLICPASPPDPPEKIKKGASYLERLGYRVEIAPHAYDRHGFLAGKDEARIADFNHFARDPQVKAIFAVRGGYGTPRLLNGIDYQALRKNPKIIVGYSDITALQLAIYRKTGLVTFSGPMPGVEFWNDPDPYTEENFWPLITSKTKPFIFKNPEGSPWKFLQEGKGEGTLLGGNLSLVNCLCGTPYAPNYRGAILVLEEVGEQPYRLDRLFVQLRNAGILGKLAGLVLGQFTECQPKSPDQPHLSLEQIMEEVAQWAGCPVLSNLQYGHIPRKLTIPFGVQAQFNSRRGEFRLTEAAVR